MSLIPRVVVGVWLSLAQPRVGSAFVGSPSSLARSFASSSSVPLPRERGGGSGGGPSSDGGGARSRVRAWGRRRRAKAPPKPVSPMIGVEIDVTIERVTNLGEGVARLPAPDGTFSYFVSCSRSIEVATRSYITTQTLSLPRRVSSAWTGSRFDVNNRALLCSALFAGRVVLVPFTMPGEAVRARVYRDGGSFLGADLVHVTAPAPARIAPACALFGTCGGCQYVFRFHSCGVLLFSSSRRSARQFGVLLA